MGEEGGVEMGRKFSPEVLKVTALSEPPYKMSFLMLLSIRRRGSCTYFGTLGPALRAAGGGEHKQEDWTKQNSLMCLSDTLW